VDGRFNILLVSRSREMLDQLEAALRGRPGLAVHRELVVNGHVDPLHGAQAAPDALVLHLSQNWREELEALVQRPAEQRPALIVLGPAADMNVMRLAMQAGARDFLPVPLVRDDLLEALSRIERDRQSAAQTGQGAVTAVVNSKGGSGATLLACNVAHLLSVLSQRRVALVDLDVQFGTLPLYLDLYPQRGLVQALANLDELDAVALDGYMTRHASGVCVLGHSGEDSVHLGEVSGRDIERMLDLLCRSYENVVIDLPRRIDPASVAVFERASQVVVVVQQSVTTLRDATRLLRILRRDVAVPRDRICVVVNRYEKNAPVTLEDIGKTLNCGDLHMVPNDFRTVSDCVNTGTPLYDYAKGTGVTRALMALEARLTGAQPDERRGLLGRTFSGILKPRSSTWQAN
jgi:pilus assembly protein CpaE